VGVLFVTISSPANCAEGVC